MDGRKRLSSGTLLLRSMSDGNGPLRSAGRWSPTAFVVAGCALSVAVLLVALSGLVNLGVPRWLPAVAGTVGLLAVLVALFGYYPLVADRSPKLAGVAAVAAALGLAVFGVAVIADLAVGGSLGERSRGATLLFVVALVAIVTSFLCYGLASARTGAPSQGIGTLLLLPAAGVLGDIVYVLASSALGVPVVSGLPTAMFLLAALAILGLGIRLRAVTSTGATRDRTDTDPTA